ncbi:NAD(P)H-binding protein [Bifidobacterium sp. ESL0763]|uniref:NAD(P)-dependent oxidoreductase n=1 Tax=Bifidobacterium sp. ESL0763 TaxID=2983227 RepID=UPI0023FA44FC|nr:NAD(P)H-binding protein [Bifidobacterium sp. ESL0763]MDF7664217.1 NAD(P)H-binding protein [Bifidobacterium sp. ESL0763]
MGKRIAVVAANGKAGRLIVEEAVGRGMDVTAVVRGENRTSAPHTIIKDLYDLTADDLAGFDVVVSAFGVFDPAKFDEYGTSLKHLADILSGTGTRLLVVGGAGSLYTNAGHTAQLSDTFPDEIKGVPLAMGKALDALRHRDDVHWTYISPAGDFQAAGPRTGHYVLAGEDYTTDADGKSAISYADYAIAMVDEVEAERPHDRERISVRW